MRAVPTALVCIAMGLSSGHDAAHAGPASTASAAHAADHMPMSDYMALLLQIAPAAQQGATAYLQAFRQRCGRALLTAELRRAMSEGDGDPVLMAMIRASQLRDAPALGRLAEQAICERWAVR